MTIHNPDPSDPAPARRYVRPPAPIHFPVEADVPEGTRHLRLRTALYQSLERAFAELAWIGSDQFVYWDPTDPHQCVAPDVMLRCGGPGGHFQVWKTWERGAPDLAVEIVSDSDRPEDNWIRKRSKYNRLGVRELVRFDPDAVDQPIRIWSRVDGDLVERLLDAPSAFRSDVVDGYWVVNVHADDGPMLRLARDPDGKELYPTPEECANEEAMRADNERARANTADARAEALARRLRELGVDPDDVE